MGVPPGDVVIPPGGIAVSEVISSQITFLGFCGGLLAMVILIRPDSPSKCTAPVGLPCGSVAPVPGGMYDMSPNNSIDGSPKGLSYSSG